MALPQEVRNAGRLPSAPSSYQKQVNLQETLLAARSRMSVACRATGGAATSRVGAVACDPRPWPPSHRRQAGAAESSLLDLSARQAEGGAIVARQSQSADGQTVHLLLPSTGTVLYLTRTVEAEQATKLSVAWAAVSGSMRGANGVELTSVATALKFGRYGCSDRFEGTRVDQVLLDLDLQPGENAIGAAAGGRRRTVVLLFRRPTQSRARVLEAAAAGFPRGPEPAVGTRACGVVRDIRLVHRAGEPVRGATDRPAGRRVRRRWSIVCAEVERLKQAQAGGTTVRWLDLCVQCSVLATLRGDLARLRAAVAALGHVARRRVPGRRIAATAG